MVIGNGTTVIFLEGLLALSHIYEKVKIIEKIEPRKPWGNRDKPFGLKKFSSCINITDKFLV